MENVQRLKIVQSGFIEDINVLIRTRQLGKKKKDIVDQICKKYNIKQETLYYRIRSFYGRSIRELQDEYFTPSKRELWEAIKSSNSSKELWSKFNISNNLKVGLLDKYFGYSTFQKCKLLEIDELNYDSITTYNPSIKDNLGIIAACRLGDCGFNYRSKHWSIRCEHCIEQEEWLKKKVEILTKSFPWMYNKTTISKRGTPTWYGGTFTSKKYNNLLNNDKKDLVKYLTPIAIWLLFLDDGSNYKVNNQRCITFAVENMEIAEELKSLLLSYGYNFTINNKNSISIKDQYQVKKFIKEFLKHYEYLTPNCMKYKMKLD